MKITNPIYQELKLLKLLKNKNLIKISNKTRDKKVAVFQDKVSKIIFLQKYFPNKKYNSNIKVNLKQLDDDFRRINQFNNDCYEKDVLDFGCGWGIFLLNLKKTKSLTGIDLRENCLDYIRRKRKKITLHNNLRDLNKKFDIITLFHVLEHMPYQINTLKNLRNYLKKKGKIIIEVPHADDFLLNFDDLIEFKHFTFWSEHLILHTYKSLHLILKRAGFKNIKIRYYQRYGFDNHLGWFVKKKPGGHNFFKKYSSKYSNENYKKNLIELKKTDTLIAEATI